MRCKHRIDIRLRRSIYPHGFDMPCGLDMRFAREWLRHLIGKLCPAENMEMQMSDALATVLTNV